MVQRAWPLPVGASDMIAMSAGPGPPTRQTNWSSTAFVVSTASDSDTFSLVIDRTCSTRPSPSAPGHRDLVGRHRDRFHPVQFGGLLVLEADQGTGGHGAWKCITITD
jgi:hypothetical protein